MVRFSSKLEDGKVRKWKQYYLAYEELAALIPGRTQQGTLFRSLSRSISLFQNGNPERQQLVNESYEEQGFDSKVKYEMGKVNDFYQKKFTDLSGRLDTVEEQLIGHDAADVLSDQEDEDEKRSLIAEDSTQRQCVDLYRQLLFLQSFAALNYTGFVKILKKYNKALKAIDHEKHSELLHSFDFSDTSASQKLITRCEKAYAERFYGGDCQLARTTLLARQRPKNNWDMFLIGLRLGVVFMLLVWTMWDCIEDVHLRPTEPSDWMDNELPVFRFVGCIVLMVWLWGLNLFVWEKFRINYLYIFEWSSEDTKGAPEVWNIAIVMSAVSLAFFLSFFKRLRSEFPGFVPQGFFPFALILYLCARFLIPLKTSKFLLKSIFSVMASPFTPVTFLAGYIGDILTSFVKVSVDLAYTVCYVGTGVWVNENDQADDSCLSSYFLNRVVYALLSGLPLWFRFMQCLRRYRDTDARWPHLGNAFKYAFSYTVVLLGVFHPDFNSSSQWDAWRVIWLICLILSTLYTFSWDVFMDWGLGDPNYQFLRRDLFFPRYFYYTAIFLDLFLRFAWSMTLIPAGRGTPFSPDVMYFITPGLVVMELFRRTMWSWFRLEYEHLSNPQGFRRVSVIPLGNVNREPPAPRKGWMILLEIVMIAILVFILGLLGWLTS